MTNNFPKFSTFLTENISEANAFGSEFEQMIADNVQMWIEQNGLDKKFEARRYQTLTEFDGNRDEDYSDVVVENLESGQQIFIECKKHIRDNISQIMVDIKKIDGYVVPIAVKGLSREEAKEPVYKAFSQYIGKNKEFQEFTEFLESFVKVDENEEYCPGDFFFDRIECDDITLEILIQHYNQLIDKGLISQRNKKFDINLIRQTTKNMLACGLLWRLCDITHTWDICHIDLNGIGFSKMIETHYLKEKAVPVNYIQIGEDLLFRFSQENPLNIDCSVFPENVVGKFDLKFTPRFGTGAMYITSRSKINQTLTAKSTFGMNEDQWPKFQG